MSTYLINASNLKKGGGGAQVFNSICKELLCFPQHKFIVLFPDELSDIEETIGNFDNTISYKYKIKKTLWGIILGYNSFLDGIVSQYQVQAVLTIFGPSYWKPQCPHLCGFAIPHLVIKDSPYSQETTFLMKIKNAIWEYNFLRCSNIFYTESPYISHMLSERFKGYKETKVYTVTNYYNQIYDDKSQWKEVILPPFDGATILTLSKPRPYKNLSIAIDIAKLWKKTKPEFSFRFVFSFDKEDYPKLDEDINEYFVFLGSVEIDECPSLYNQCTVVFMPSLLECFTATYPEAMKMNKPIVTTDLDFAKSLCGEAASYYSATDPQSAADALYKVITDATKSQQLVNAGGEQLLCFDNYNRRAEKLIGLLDTIS